MELDSNLFRTIEIFNETESYLMYEQIIKALAEPIVIKALKEANEYLNINYNGWFMVSRGGDALNYYYPVNGYIPTNDWDFGLMRVPNSQIDFTTYTNISIWLSEWMKKLASELSNHFEKNVNAKYNLLFPQLNKDTFYYNKSNFPRLHHIEFEYLYRKEKFKNIVIDVMVYGNGLERNSIPNIKGWESKFTYDTLLDYYDQMDKQGIPKKSHIDISPYIIQYILDPEKRYYNNTFELIVQDIKSGMYYMAPGDLLSDTLIMIWQSITNKNVAIKKNKLPKYLIKYSVLLDAINKMINICPKNSCEKINQYILSRNTENNKSIIVTEEPVMKEFYLETFLHDTAIWGRVPTSKLAEMVLYLKMYTMIFNILLDMNRVPSINRRDLTTSQIYSLIEAYMLLKEMDIYMSALTNNQIIEISNINFADTSRYDRIFSILGIRILIPLITRTNTLGEVSKEKIIKIVKSFIKYQETNNPEYVLGKYQLTKEDLIDPDELESIFDSIIIES
jgi:hypothetical protein